MKSIKICLALLCVLVAGYFIIGSIVLPKDAPGMDHNTEIYDGKWEWLHNDGSISIHTLPAVLPVERGETVLMRTLLDDDTVGYRYMRFQGARQDMRIYVGDELRVSYSTKATRITGRYSAPAFVFCELKPQDSGKYLTFESVTESSFNGIFRSVYLGDRFSLWYSTLSEQGIELLFAFLTLFLGVISIAGSVILGIKQHRRVELMYLGTGISMAAVWLIANSWLRQLFFPAFSVINDMTFSMMLLLPLPFLIYMDEVQKGRYRRLYIISGCVAVLDCIVCGMLHITGTVDFSDSFWVMAIVCFGAIAIMGGTIIRDCMTGVVKEYPLVALGMLGVTIAAAGQIFVYFRKSDQFHTTILALGLIYLLIISIVNTLKNILKIDRDKQTAILESEAEERFLANMSHEIRTPINAVLGMNSMILRESSEENIRGYAEDINSAGNTLLSLVNDVLDLSRIRAGRMELTECEYGLGSLIYDCYSMILLKAEDKGLELELNVSRSLPSQLYGDEVKLRQILINLLNNAVKYTEKGSVILKVEGHREDGECMLDFSVTDTGIGIKEEDLGKLCEQYKRIDEVRNRNIEGTGLGMNITASLLKIMGSELDVTSEYGRGSVFSFKLRQRITDNKPLGPLKRTKGMAQEYGYRPSFAAPDAHILVVDDNEMNCRVFKAMLKYTRVHIEEARSGEAMLEMTASNDYDIIFLDHMMQGMNGIEALRLFRPLDEQRGKHTPVVALTANAIMGARETYLSEGFDDFMAKPIQADKLESMVVSLLPDELLEEFDEVKAPADDHVSGEAEALEMEIEGVDVDYAMLKTKDAKLLHGFMEDFASIYEDELSELKGYYESLLDEGFNSADFFNEYEVKVHAMKTEAAMIGALNVSAYARMLERAADGRDAELMKAVMPVFEQEWGLLGTRLNELLNERK